MKIAVVYKSSYGATKKYAEWIANALNADLFDKNQVEIKNLYEYDTLIYGGGLYAGGVAGAKFLAKNYDKIAGKNLILFTCGLADVNDKQNISNIQKGIKRTFSQEMLSNFKLFHLRGNIDYSKLSLIHSLMMKMLYFSLKMKKEESLSAENKGFIATFGQTADFTNEKFVKPIVDYVKNLK